MSVFYDTFGFVAAVCLGVVMLALFFIGVSWLGRLRPKASIVRVKGFVRDGAALSVHLSSGKILTGVRFAGFTEHGSGKSGVPYPLNSMVVLESQGGRRILVRAETVRMIEEIAETNAASGSQGIEPPRHKDTERDSC